MLSNEKTGFFLLWNKKKLWKIISNLFFNIIQPTQPRFWHLLRPCKLLVLEFKTASDSLSNCVCQREHKHPFYTTWGLWLWSYIPWILTMWSCFETLTIAFASSSISSLTRGELASFIATSILKSRKQTRLIFTLKNQVGRTWFFV